MSIFVLVDLVTTATRFNLVLSDKEPSRFWALTPTGDTTAINALAARLVEGLDHHQDLLTDAEITRRRRSGLDEVKDRLMLRWGIPTSWTASAST